MQTRPIPGSPLGVEVLDFDHTRPISADDKAQLNQLLGERRLLLFRNGDMGDQAHVNLIAALDTPVREGATGELHSFNSTVREDVYIAGRTGIPLHSDYLFSSHGPIHVVSLAALKMEVSEPTSFCDSVEAFKRLPGALQEKLRKLNFVQCQVWRSPAPVRMRVSDFADVPRQELSVATLPAVLKHPHTGAEVLLHSGYMTSHVEGWSNEQSDELFAEIVHYQYQPEAIYEHQWEEGDTLVWDNIALQHGRRPIAPGGERLLRRVAGNGVPIHVVMDHVVPPKAANRTPASADAV